MTEKKWQKNKNTFAFYIFYIIIFLSIPDKNLGLMTLSRLYLTNHLWFIFFGGILYELGCK